MPASKKGQEARVNLGAYSKSNGTIAAFRICATRYAKATGSELTDSLSKFLAHGRTSDGEFGPLGPVIQKLETRLAASGVGAR